MDSSKRKLREKCLKDRLSFVEQNGAFGLVNPVLNQMSSEQGIWGGFMATAAEPDLGQVYKMKGEVTWAFPRMNGDEMEFFISQEPQGYIKGNLGILEPDPAGSTKVNVKDLKGVLIPGVAFDESGYRLGRGRGYFDRFLSEFKGLKIGVCFSVQLFPAIPRESHDVRMDMVITEKRIIRTSA